MVIRSRERTRVASKDWWASRKVVSVISSFFWLRIQSLRPSGPCWSRYCFRPVGRGTSVKSGTRGAS